MKLPFFILLVAALFATQCKTYEPSVVIKVVNQKAPTQPIAGAKVTILSEEGVTDADGFVTLDIDLDRFILDRKEVRAGAPGFIDSIANVLVGKDQQETIIIPLKPENRLVYIPDSLVIQASEVFRDIRVINEGLDPIPVTYLNNNLAWVDLTPSKDTIYPDKEGFLRVITNPINLNCKVEGVIKSSWVNDNGQEQPDQIPVTKFIPDNQPPFPDLKIKQNNTIVLDQKVYINKEVTFDAGGSTDNCKAYSPLQYNWDFGDNNPTGFDEDHVVYKHTFTELGPKTISLWVQDANPNVALKQRTINVELEPSPPHIDNAISAVQGPSLLSVNLSGRILDFGFTYNSLTDYGFVYSNVVDMPTLEEHSSVSFGATSQSPQTFTFDTTITSLQPKRYWFRAYAKNAGFDAVYSDPVYFDVVLARFKAVGGSIGGQFLAQRGDNDSPFQDQKPESIITLKNFQITETEITNEQYAAFLNDGPSPPTQAQNFIALNINNAACKIAWNGNSYQVIAGEENKPVVTVTYLGAEAFCAFLLGRLPTEAEWEAAARATAQAVYPQWSGTSVNPPSSHVVFNSPAPEPVTSKPGNAYELRHMSGNVAEWVKDWYATYSLQSLDNPQGPNSSPSGERVIRGGSYQDQQEQTTVTYRGRLNPIVQSPRVGFRVVKN
ncbi:MAG: SUMF1/EgtB/PvdO family nonheme iron enzyme [Saprospiraceae bacterium]|nr:SUMF1/EgtB/PvdO family nonheme iron enzyme [Saprospiraceae bacterium]